MAMQDVIVSGFSDPVRDQQRAFRAVMDALARPAQPISFASDLAAAGPLVPNAFAIALTLLDFEVRYHLSAGLAAAASHVTFHTGSRETAAPGEAEFAFVDLASDPLDLAAFAQGEPDYPDRSTTIIAIAAGGQGGVTLPCRGPGIAGQAMLTIAGLPDDFVAQWQANSARAPLGVDLVFVTPEAIIGLPRSTRLVGEVR